MESWQYRKALRKAERLGGKPMGWDEAGRVWARVAGMICAQPSGIVDFPRTKARYAEVVAAEGERRARRYLILGAMRHVAEICPDIDRASARANIRLICNAILSHGYLTEEWTTL